MTMRNIILLSVFVVAANAAPNFNPYPNGYHIDVGIPLAKRVYEIETGIRDGSRIANGRPSPLGNHPYLAGVLSNIYNSQSQSLSTASLLTNTKLIFAAHNWNNDGANFAYSSLVVLGSETVFSGGERILTDQVEIHPQWDFRTLANDVAIITIPAVQYSNVIQPVALPVGNLQNNDFSGLWAQAAGFGMLANGGLAQVRQEVDLQVISNIQCRSSFPNNVFDSTICTSSAGGVGICTGDSGGPLSVALNGEQVLIGVTSFSSGGCGDSQWPNAFARVSYFVPWILERL